MSFKKQKKKRKSPIKDWRKAKKKKKKRKFPDQRLEESERKKKKISRSKIGRKQKQNIQKGRWTRQCLNNVQNCHKQEDANIYMPKKKGKKTMNALCLANKITFNLNTSYL